jgi:hypothetical protein
MIQLDTFYSHVLVHQLNLQYPDMDLNIDPQLSSEMWSNYYEKRRIKKEAKSLQKDRK